jgi:hypothetical protein
MKRISVFLLVACMLFGVAGCGSPDVQSSSADESVTQDQPEITAYLLEPGEVFEPGGYIEIENVRISYKDGESFAIQNNRDDIIRITSCIVGVKKNGTYESLQWPAFGGTDEAQYKKDVEENGWAVKHSTNMVRPGETLNASMVIFNFDKFSEDYPAPDIDQDGYYDIIFTVHPQTSEDRIMTSKSDPESEIYKLKAK